ncbi:SnoaL-like domain-containing protein [Pseudonocardia ammonioxydans]|uniref:SnoaL-like domain-containing protein n=1 Tax=Pseudonocardia ammonioxydans TaxID=260086 RepID=A0A1I5HPB8_PSUAM|nr:nuclear transport factor 2 family protein [Pseudonocardia ammonioxydans]SFO50103.1 SnoaL-like domain-containing protein [Pseudonocardia ammonioxydans]
MTWDLQTLSDRAEILELRSRYARALDERDWDLMRTVFAKDASADFALGTPFDGIDEIIRGCRSQMDSLDHTQHFLGNHEITVDGDRASGRHKLIGGAFLQKATGTPSAALHGDYVDEYVRTEEGWRISRRQLTITWGEGNVGILSQQHS